MEFSWIQSKKTTKDFEQLGDLMQSLLFSLLQNQVINIFQGSAQVSSELA